MKWIAEISYPRKLNLVIQPEEYSHLSDNKQNIEYKIIIYENGLPKYDYVQEQLEWAKEFALDKFQVPLEAWKLVE